MTRFLNEENYEQDEELYNQNIQPEEVDETIHDNIHEEASVIEYNIIHDEEFTLDYVNVGSEQTLQI